MKLTCSDDGTRCNEPTRKGVKLSDRGGRRKPPMVCDEAETIAKHLNDRRVIRIAQARRRLDQRIKYPLQIEGRLADDLQNVGGGRLLLQGFRQFARPRLLSLE